MNNNGINGFTFYRNYFDLLNSLKKEDKLLLLNAIVDYVFLDKEPELDGLNLAIWNNIKMPINTSKTRAESGKSKTKSKQNQSGNKTKSKGVTNNISYFLFLISNFKYLEDRGLLRGKIEDWVKYKWERKEYYKEMGFKSLLTRIQKNCELYGEQAVIDLIDECMACNYKGIIFEKLEKPKAQNNYKTIQERNAEVIAMEREKLRKEKEYEQGTSN